MSELARIVAAARCKVLASAIFVNPDSPQDVYAGAPLWDAVASIPNLTARIDIDGSQADRCGAATSGYTLLYDPRGNLIFSGGITESRGHEGDNFGESKVIALINGGLCPEAGASADPVAQVHTPVFGCALFNSERN